MVRLFKPSRWIDWIFPKFTWRFFVTDKKIFITFDDGPNPEITPFVLDELKKRNWTATFFCVGENITRYPNLVQRIKDEGHEIGNHTFRHEKGHKSTTEDYIASFRQFESVQATTLFRPPYGRITRNQAKIIEQTHKIIMWSWLSYDYDKKLALSTILKKAKKIQPGAILVLHDNPKISERQQELLPQLFTILAEKGFYSSKITLSDVCK